MVATIDVSSKVFSAGEEIPSRYTCDGEDVNPPLTIGKLPDKTQSLALIVEDPDAPMGTWDHWLVWNIPPTGEISEDSIPGTEGKNSFHKHHYGGPCPPSGTHRYFFKIYALDSQLDLGADTDKEALEKAMVNKILGRGEIMCLYSKK